MDTRHDLVSKAKTLHGTPSRGSPLCQISRKSDSNSKMTSHKKQELASPNDCPSYLRFERLLTEVHERRGEDGVVVKVAITLFFAVLPTKFPKNTSGWQRSCSGFWPDWFSLPQVSVGPIILSFSGLRARLKRCARALFPVTLSRWNAADRTTVISPMPNGAAWSRWFPPPNMAGVPPNTLGVRS